MSKRPTSVTVIAWILVISAVLSLITSTASLDDPKVMELMAKNSLSIPAQYVLLYGGLLITLVSGLAMFKGLRWARLLYVAWSTIGIAIGLLTSPMKMMMVPGIVLFVVMAFFLFRPKANAYFGLQQA